MQKKSSLRLAGLWVTLLWLTIGPSYGQTVSESGEAGDVPSLAQDASGIPVTSITGYIPPAGYYDKFNRDVDMYKITIGDPAAFSATTFDNGTGFNTYLFLFDSEGKAVYMHDDIPRPGYITPYLQSTLPASHALGPTTAGDYYLAVTGYICLPYDEDGNLVFETGLGRTVVHGPSLSDKPVVHWQSPVYATFHSGDYQIDLTGVGPLPETNTPVGESVVVEGLHVDVPAIVFQSVTEAGDTTVTTSPTNPGPEEPGFQFGYSLFYDVTTTATYEGPVVVTLNYDDTGISEEEEQYLELLHLNATWEVVTSSLDTFANTISGSSGLLSFFAVALNLPPVADAGGPYLGAAGSPIVFDGTGSSDPDGDPVAYDWDFGDGIGSDILPVPAYTYVAAGIYDVCLTVTDPGGLSDTVCTIAIVYDPSAGFVTGGGWIYSEPGAYSPDPFLEGKASFGFVSKYKKGTSVPTGNTEFQFKAGDLNFHSSSYDWLVVTGANYAKFKGTGTINGSGEYKFQIWAGDDILDTFRIKIWTEDQFGIETVVYDNGFDQGIGGGSIVIHAK